MNQKHRKITVIFTAFILLTGFTYVLSVSDIGEKQASFIDETGSEKAEITYETAVSSKEKRTGLMNRTELGQNHGMIFVYDNADIRSFWMKNTLIPLDIIFLDSDKQIINIEKAYPEPNTPDSELERYRSDAPAQYVIEVNQNFTDRHGIEQEDRVEFSVN
jgi:uncharacterized membrane protein (UPF0127 family)